MKFRYTVISLIISVVAWAQTGKVQIEITQIKNAKGVLGLALYNNAQDFTKKEFKTAIVKAQKGKVTAVFDLLPPGNYAIAVLHDENANDKMDFNLIGIPKEAYGFSNNAKAVFAPPKFQAAAFWVKNGETTIQRIALN